VGRAGVVLLRTALGTATAPPNSCHHRARDVPDAFVMARLRINPTTTHQAAVRQPYSALTTRFAAARGAAARIQQKNVREKIGSVSMDLSGEARATAGKRCRCDSGAGGCFMISELKRALRISASPVSFVSDHRPRGRLGADSMGMMMLAAGVVHWPFKLIFFRGWSTAGRGCSSLGQIYGGCGRMTRSGVTDQ